MADSRVIGEAEKPPEGLRASHVPLRWALVVFLAIYDASFGIWCVPSIRIEVFRVEQRRSYLMITFKSQFIQQAVAAITLVLVLGALSMIWPGIIALFLGILLLLQSCSVGQEMAALSWAEADHVSIAFATLRRPGLPAMLW